MHPSREAASQAIRGDLPPEVAFAGGRIESATERLPSIEEAAVVHAVAKRRDEFVAGRAYARRALAALGVGRVAIPVGSDRAPVWPAGIVGSISHCREYCAAIVARSETFAAVGFDVEPDDALDDDLVATICSPLDLAAARKYGILASKLIFCIKESVYKAYFPLARTILDFGDVAVETADGGNFTARLTRNGIPPAAGVRTFQGRFVHAGGLVAAWTLIRA